MAEDEASIRSLWERFLSKWGYDSALAENGQTALEKARQKFYPLVITDLTMPVLTGRELLYSLKAEQPGVEIIIITGNGTIEIAVEMMKAGAYDFLTKPINFEHAELVVRKCLESAAEKKENQRLRQVNRDLAELNELKEKFIAITSHELRTPVSVISNVVEMIGPELGGDERFHSLISRSAQQLSEIVGQMHEISGSIASEPVLQWESFELAGLCGELLEELSWVFEKRGHVVELAFVGALTVHADRIRLKKVLRELLQNAIKFTQDGGKITVEAGFDSANELRITVADSGVGISRDNLDKIFDLFYEVGDPLHHHTSKEAFLGGGIGVGLAMARELVSAHGGRIDVESEVGRGSSFTVTIPRQHAA